MLRLHPPVPVNSRTAVRDTILPVGGGPDGQAPVLVLKGTMVGYSVYAMHRQPALYGMDAEIFRPERWSEDMPLRQDPVNAAWGYLPFNNGPRVCLGMDFGLTEAGYAIVRLLQTFPRMRRPEKDAWKVIGKERQTVALVLSITDGCNVEVG